jgi:hypothetical protein
MALKFATHQRSCPECELIIGRILISVFDRNDGKCIGGSSFNEMVRLALDWANGSRSRHFLGETCNLEIAESRSVTEFYVWILTEGANETKVGIQRLVGGLIGVRVVVEIKNDLASLTVDGEQKLTLFFAIGEGGDIGSVELVDNTRVETTGRG